MFNNRILLGIGIVSLLLVTMAVSRPLTNTSVPDAAGANDFYQRHPDWIRNAVGSDYYERHSALNGSTTYIADLAGDFALRHPEWTVGVPNLAIPVTGILEASDYFQRHPQPSSSVNSTLDLTDYFVRHPELLIPNSTTDLSDYFLRH